MASCPVCEGELSLKSSHDVEYTSCDGCGGVFVSQDAFRALVDVGECPASGRRKDKGQAIACLSCGEDMEDVQYAGDSGILIRKCESCKATWLKKGQIGDIHSYVHGLKRYNDKVNDLQIELSKTTSYVASELKEAYKSGYKHKKNT